MNVAMCDYYEEQIQQDNDAYDDGMNNCDRIYYRAGMMIFEEYQRAQRFQSVDFDNGIHCDGRNIPNVILRYLETAVYRIWSVILEEKKSSNNLRRRSFVPEKEERKMLNARRASREHRCRAAARRRQLWQRRA